ncbi:cache domain-containing sensor histidine kinase [Cohnella soli]|uniref:Sensor histidine kinase n=1 Tax=Cohnella soli TaxID=425005 RepID=A0ABW0HPB1_9BACL
MRFQLRVSFILITSIALILSALLTYFGVLGILEKKTNDSTMQYFLQAGDSVNEFREEIDKMTKQLLIDPKIQQFLDNDSKDIPSQIQLHRDLMDEMDAYLRTYEYLDSIYLYAEDGRAIGVAGQKTALLRDDAKQGRFYSSDLHRESLHSDLQKTYPKLVWEGANRSEDFGEPARSAEGKAGDQNLVTAARSVKSLYQSLPTAIMILNVKEEKLFSLYNNLKSKLNGQIYLCDAGGRMISHADKTQLGSSSAACAQIPEGQESGSVKGKDEQIVFYRIPSTEWTMVKEVPLHELIGDILNLRFQLFWIVGACFVAAFVASALWIRKITRPLHTLIEAMSRVEKGQLEIALDDRDLSEFGRLSSGFNRMSLGIKQLIERNREAEKEKTKAEIRMLQAQINPHFLFNTLNTIKWMSVVAKSDNITKSIAALSNLLRPIFKSTAPLCTMQEELEYAEHYVTILNYRYGEGIEIKFEVSEAASFCAVPRFFLQPLIENAVLHGFERTGYTGTIRIEAERLRTDLFVRVIDDGQGMTEERLSGVRRWISEDEAEENPSSEASEYGIGLKNVHRRIKLNFSESPGLSILRTASGGTCIEISIPVDDT